MNKIFKIIASSLFVLSVAGFTSVSSAEQVDKSKRNGKSVEQKLEKMTKKLDLTDSQAAQIRVILQEAKDIRKASHEKIKTLREQGLGKKEIRETLKSERMEKREMIQNKILGVLNADQAAKIKLKWQKRKEKMARSKE